MITAKTVHISSRYVLKTGTKCCGTPTISTVINQMKGYVTKQIGFSLWQKLFHDHIIRNEQEYEKIYEYIETNPLKWGDDEYYI